MNKQDEKMMIKVLGKWAKEKKDKVAVECEGDQVTYNQFNDTTNSVANGVLALGVKKGQSVCIMLPNGIEFLFAAFGLMKAGAVIVPLNNAYKGDILTHVLNNCEAEVMVVHPSFIERIELVEKDLAFLKTMIVCQEKNQEPLTEKKRGKFSLLPFNDLYKYPAAPPPVDIRAKDVASVMYTSGTTGLSKGGLQTHRMIYQAAVDHAENCRITENDIIYAYLPFFHGIALGLSVGSAFFTGAKIVIGKGFKLDTFWKDVKACKATYFAMVSAIANFLLMLPDDDDKNNQVRIVYSIPAPGADVYTQFEERYGLKITEAYGSTDGAVITYSPYDHPKIGSCGKIIEGYELKIVDDDDEEVPRGVMGEIVYRSKNPYTMSLGYYKNPQATMDVHRNFWFHSGDGGYLDEDGYLHFVDRKKDALRRRGENVSSFEIEKVFNAHPDVFESAVVAVPSDVGEDDIKICVILHGGKATKVEELLCFCEDRMPYYMMPRYVEFMSDFPRTPVGKVQKYKLREQGVTSNTWDAKKEGYKPKK